MKNQGFNATLTKQGEFLIEILKRNEPIYGMIEMAESFGLSNWYVGAGCITQTVWNYLTEKPLLDNIKDIDLVYFDSTDLSEDAEKEAELAVKTRLDAFPLQVDVKNEARVHLWYRECFGYDISPYESVEDAINTWPTTATSIGINTSDGWQVYAPFGLNDLFGMVVRANKAQITEEIYRNKVERWHKHWPTLRVIPWHEN